MSQLDTSVPRVTARMLRPLLLTLSVLPAAADDADLSLPFAQSSAYNTQTAFLD